jgi:hypothetical protein
MSSTLDDVTPSKLAVDREIEHGQVTFLAVHLQLGADRPYVLGLQRRPGADDFSLIPGNFRCRWMSVVR